MSNYQLGIVGCGNMGEAILKGILDSRFLKPEEIIFYDRDGYRKKYIKRNYKVSAAKEVTESVKKARYILLAVKPQDLKTVLDQIKIVFNYKANSIISIVAGIPTSYIEKMLNSDASVVRIMPNMPALFGKGMAAVSKGRFVKNRDLLFSKKLIKSVGDYVLIEEKYQNIATALSGSGPAYFFLFCKYLIDAGIKNGLIPEVSKKLVTGTMIGAGITIVKSGSDPENLIKKIASPGGTTEMALKEFTGSGLDKIVTRAVKNAKIRAHELQKFLN